MALSPIDTSREACPSQHSTANKVARLLWRAIWLFLFRPSPASLRGWRRFLLRCFGARLGKGVKVMPSTRVWAPWNLTMGDEACLSHDVDCYNVAPIEIGAHATVSQYAFLCAASHDITDPRMALVRAPIHIGPAVWVCAGAYVGMGVTVGEGAVCAARAVVVRDVPPWTVVGGNPARAIGTRTLKKSSEPSSRPPDSCPSPS
jgi:putative colanic acid biosynthesis acetyltransferase WcaF